MALMATGRCSPGPAHECSSMFLTIESARLPCCTIFSRLPRSVSAISPISGLSFASQVCAAKCLLQLIDQLDGNPREVVDEIKRVFDLMCDTGCQLTQRSKFL